MQRIYFKKLIPMNHLMSELISIHLDDAISYAYEEKGLRASGQIMIKGEYLKKDQREQFNEVIDIDILAPFNKIIDEHQFALKIQDYDYSNKNGNLLVSILVIIEGVVDSEDKFIDDYDIRNQVEDSLVEEIEEVVNNEVLEDIKEEIKVEENDDEEYVPLYIVRVKENDTYETIANRYHIDSKKLENYNRNKQLKKDMMVIIPYE